MVGVRNGWAWIGLAVVVRTIATERCCVCANGVKEETPHKKETAVVRMDILDAIVVMMVMVQSGLWSMDVCVCVVEDDKEHVPSPGRQTDRQLIVVYIFEKHQ